MPTHVKTQNILYDEKNHNKNGISKEGITTFISNSSYYGIPNRISS
jgi:hypothetical protein